MPRAGGLGEDAADLGDARLHHALLVFGVVVLGVLGDVEVLIAGRVMAKRVQGKIAFLELRESGCDTIQSPTSKSHSAAKASSPSALMRQNS